MDQERAFNMFRLSALQDHSESQNKLGECYLYGCGVERDSLEAYYWFMLSSSFGSVDGYTNRIKLMQELSQEQIDLVNSRADVWLEERGMWVHTSYFNK